MKTYPFTTLIIPIRNEGKFIRATLDAVFTQDYPSECLEVIVVDGMSEDHTREIVNEYQCYHVNLYLIDNPGRIVPTGMNLALRRARGEIIIRVDGHCIIASDYISRCVAHILNDGADGVGGPMHTIGETTISKAIALVMSSRFGVGDSHFRVSGDKTILADSVPFPAYTRSVIKRAGLYDEELVRNQDDEYNYRLRKLGAKILLASDVRSQYFSRGSVQKLWKQYYQYGYWKVRVLQKHPHQMRPRQFIPPLFAASLLTAIVIIPLWNFAFLFVMIPYLFTNLVASTTIARRHGWHYLCLLPIIYTAIHLSYGFGFLAGLIMFANRWGDRSGKVPAW